MLNIENAKTFFRCVYQNASLSTKVGSELFFCKKSSFPFVISLKATNFVRKISLFKALQQSHFNYFPPFIIKKITTMKQLSLLMLCLWMSFPVLAQEAEDIAQGSFAPWNPMEQGKEQFCYTLVADANVRDKANSTATVIAKLPIATKVKIESVTTDSLVLNGFQAPWCKVSFTLAGKSQSGYLWGGVLAFVTYEVKEEYDEQRFGLMYLAGISKVDVAKNKWTLQMRVAKKGVELSKIEFESPGDVGYWSTMKNLGNLGLKNVKDAIAYQSYYPACGYPSTDFLIVFANNKLTKILDCTSVSDAGAFYDTQDYLLPNEKGGIQGHIIVVNSSAETEEKEVKPGVFEYINNKQTYSIQLHKWTGEKLQKVKELK